MRNRLNVVFNGKRTTARFPEYLWSMALASSGLSDDDLASRLRETMALSPVAIAGDSTASDGVRAELVSMVMAALPVKASVQRCQTVLNQSCGKRQFHKNVELDSFGKILGAL